MINRINVINKLDYLIYLKKRSKIKISEDGREIDDIITKYEDIMLDPRNPNYYTEIIKTKKLLREGFKIFMRDKKINDILTT